MKTRLLRIGILGWLALCLRVLGQTGPALPVELRHVNSSGENWFNFQSQGGVPISRTANVPLGSNGKQPSTVDPDGLPANITNRQFGAVLPFGATAGRVEAAWRASSNSIILRAGVAAFSGTVAQQMGLPVALSNGVVTVVMRRSVAGASYIGRSVSYLFGQVIPPPEVDENGQSLAANANMAYWLPEPYSSGDQQSPQYYWSPHAGVVYAAQAGAIFITWRKAEPYTEATRPTTYVNTIGASLGIPNYETIGTRVFLLSTQRYLVSGGAVKPARKMYWTQKGFQNLGVPIRVPAARVGAVNIVYNNNFPRTVAEEFKGLGATSPTDGSTNATLKELRTLWYDQQLGNIYAYNTEGRVFVELLGDRREDGVTYQPLGTEIVDVMKQAIPSSVTIELGERVVPPDDGHIEDLFPSPLPQATGERFVYQHSANGTDTPTLYATRETRNLNDFLVHWLEEGEAGLRWPESFGRYALVWPSDVSRYSHYVRSAATTDAMAAATAVWIDPSTAPNIEYQDPLDRPRAKFTQEFRFYTWLDERQPVHRTLLRFASGDNIGFERVFSWLDSSLRSTNFAKATVSASAWNIMGGLTAWNEALGRFEWPQDIALSAPRVVNATANVGERILPPAETDSVDGAGYLAGYIHRPMGTSYSTTAYVNPLTAGFAAANKSSIIPVNAIPGKNMLEVWWFRPNSTDAGLNANNQDVGFPTIYWPSVIARYTLQWPAASSEIVMASNDGGALVGTQAKGRVYFENDVTKDGYNPNEEHAIMLGDKVYALRDDLNQTGATDAAYSSDPFVMVEHLQTDGRPDMAVFRVRREKPEAGLVFDYMVPAGQPLQPPAPLNLLAKPVEGSGDAAINYNAEPPASSGDIPGGWANESARLGREHYATFTYRDRKQNFWVYRGPHRGLEALSAGRYDAGSRQFQPTTTAAAVVGSPFVFAVHASRQSEYLALDVVGMPAWLAVNGLVLTGTPGAGDEGTVTLQLVVRDLYDNTRVTNALSLTVSLAGTVSGQAALAIVSTNAHTGSVVVFTNRPPFLGESPTSANSFTMRYYYKTEAGFAWPGFAQPPATGTIVPYLRRWDATSQGYVGNASSKATASLDIVYRPYWPVRDPKDSSKPVATLPYGGTLAKPTFGLPGIRDFKTARVLYQQSIATNIVAAKASVVLHDPTRAKSIDIASQFPDGLPPGLKTETLQGKVYFPGLPPHLGKRLYVDPNMSPKGSLVLVGEYKSETLGESYLQLNVLRGSDLDAAFALYPQSDSDGYGKWTNMVGALATGVQMFTEDLPARPGSYVASSTRTVGVGEMAEVLHDNEAVDSYALSATGPGSGYVTVVEAGGTAFTAPGDPVALHVFKVGGWLHSGELKVLPAPNPLSEMLTLQHSPDLAGRFDEYQYEWKIAPPVDGFPPLPDATMSRYVSLTSISTNVPRFTLGGAGVQALSDNYVVMRYRPMNPSHPLYRENPTDADWSSWTQPALAEGWIKRVLAGINPFGQRVTDMFNNQVNTDVSIVTQAGARWEGDVALNQETINNYGLVEIYETVLRRGRMLSIESGYNYGPANDALLLAAGYLSDLYMMLGNEAWADAANPTIGIGTAKQDEGGIGYGNISTALFSFKGQLPTLLEEELALLRGRDDFLQPGVETAPVYNRLVWNYTRGIDSGEVIYAINYNIREKPDEPPDGVINAADAARMFPQGHGDAYGHYLTAIKGYYSLLLNREFDWVPRIEAVNVLGKPVSVDYQDERKFAAAAAAVARAGQQIFDLTWRKDYKPVASAGWRHFAETRVNTRRSYVSAVTGATTNPVRHWGMDPWASRVAQGAYVNWVVGNAILPHEDPDPSHEGIQKVDRTTVPELQELPTLAEGLQTSHDNAEGAQSPLGIPEDGMVFDLNPNLVVGVDGGTHFEQVFARATSALGNAVAAFDAAKDVSRLLRSEQDSLADFQAGLVQQEHSYTNALIEIYGTPYTDDIGPGRLYKQGYAGPDLVHYKYVDLPEQTFTELWSYTEGSDFSFKIWDVPDDWLMTVSDAINFTNKMDVTFHVGPHGFSEKPSTWTGQRASPGSMQQAISDLISSHMRLRQAINDAAGDVNTFYRYVMLLQAEIDTHERVRDSSRSLLVAEEVFEKVKFANETFQLFQDSIKEDIAFATDSIQEAIPGSFVVGLASGGDLTSAARSAVEMAGYSVVSTLDKVQVIRNTVVNALEQAVSSSRRWIEFDKLEPLERAQELRAAVNDIGNFLGSMQVRLWTINNSLREYDDKKRAVRALEAQGDRLLAERMVFRQRAAAMVQGYRTRDAAFRLFRNERLERYKALFDLAARYALLAANAYDYETGLLGTSAGRSFKSRIIASRALGVVADGVPQFAGSNTGDPGLSSALAEMKSDWDVLKTRLGFNRPDAYSTTVSVRTEKLRILPGVDGDTQWQDFLNAARMPNILEDSDVRRLCMQADPGDGLPVPGIVITFSTTIAEGLNLFGLPLAGGDHAYSASSFATKIGGVGVAFPGYLGMSDPPANDGADGASPADPPAWFLSKDGLAATPYVYLIPVGVDSMRSPPLGDRSEIRSWNVSDLAIPMPFNIGASDFDKKKLYLSSDSLTEPLFNIRKHGAFRPVADASKFELVFYSDSLPRTEFINNRLVGRSVWNSQWKLIIPGRTLLNDPNKGLDRFIRTVSDIQLNFTTYSYSGN